MKKECTICGRKTNRTYNLYGYKQICSKHMHQVLKHGKPLDNNPRTINDLNDYTTDGKIAEFNLYNQRNEKIGKFIIDFEDLEKVKYHKWRLSHSHIVTGLPAKGNQRELSHVVLNIKKGELSLNQVVDHINGNGFDNRKSNLRICTQGDNAINKSFMSNNTSGFIGISFKKDRNTYDPEIRLNKKRCHLGQTKSLEEAVYKRYYAEKLIFKEYANEEEHKKKRDFCIGKISKERVEELQKMVIDKLTAKEMLPRQ